jgi:hypothetical protein
MIVLVHVQPRPGNTELGSSSGAFLNALGDAVDVTDFKVKVVQSLSACGFDVLEIEDAEAFDDRIAKFEVEPELHSLANEVRKWGGVKFGTFHCYPKEGHEGSASSN